MFFAWLRMVFVQTHLWMGREWLHKQQQQSCNVVWWWRTIIDWYWMQVKSHKYDLIHMIRLRDEYDAVYILDRRTCIQFILCIEYKVMNVIYTYIINYNHLYTLYVQYCNCIYTQRSAWPWSCCISWLVWQNCSPDLMLTARTRSATSSNEQSIHATLATMPTP